MFKRNTPNASDSFPKTSYSLLRDCPEWLWPGIYRGLVLGFCLSLNCCPKLFWVSACHFRGTSGLKSTLHKALEQSLESPPASLHCCIQPCLMRWPDSLDQVHLSLLKGKLLHWGGSEQDPAASPWGQAPHGSGHGTSLAEFKKLLEALRHVVWLLGMVLLRGWSRWSSWVPSSWAYSVILWLLLYESSLKAYHHPVLFERRRGETTWSKWGPQFTTEIHLESPVWDSTCKLCTDIFLKDLHAPARLLLELKRLKQLLLSWFGLKQVNGNLSVTLCSLAKAAACLGWLKGGNISSQGHRLS